jgi:hypothetical protein
MKIRTTRNVIFMAQGLRAINRVRKQRAMYRKLRIRERGYSSTLWQFNYDFWTSLYREIRIGLVRNVGWTYVRLGGRTRWYLTYKGCMRAVKRDAEDGHIDPKVMVRMQSFDTGKQASMVMNILKDPI